MLTLAGVVEHFLRGAVPEGQDTDFEFYHPTGSNSDSAREDQCFLPWTQYFLSRQVPGEEWREECLGQRNSIAVWRREESVC